MVQTIQFAAVPGNIFDCAGTLGTTVLEIPELLTLEYWSEWF